jgi:DNA polymerase I-like protein with 3'-5' exonuclease and polymerase domains/uracil-DNA glycosylase
LTGRGWVPLGELTEGDDLVCGDTVERMSLSDPDVHKPPTRIDQAFAAATHTGVRHRVIGRHVDFHGDGCPTDVEVVTLNRLLCDQRRCTASDEQSQQLTFKASLETASTLQGGHTALSAQPDLCVAVLPSTAGYVSRLQHCHTLVRREELPTQSTGLTECPYTHAQGEELLFEPSLADSMLSRQPFDTGSRLIRTAKILKVERCTRWSGHVYNLQTVSGEYTANGFIVHNCCPPQYEIQPAWAEAAAAHCRQYSDPALSQSPVVLAMGGTAIRRLLGLWAWDLKNLVENFHGTVHDLPSGQRVVCTFHPSYLQRGATNLFGTVLDDIAVAYEVAEGRWRRDLIDPVVDPHPGWFREYVDQYLAAVAAGACPPLAADIETPDKEKGKSEDELDESDQSMQILRLNFAYHPDEGVTVPALEPWWSMALELLAAAPRLYWWNGDYDLKRLLARQVTFAPHAEHWDGMWLWHHLKSDVPRGLGFAAPSASTHGAWKHLYRTDPGRYAAYDGPQTLRTVNSTVETLIARGQWDVAYRHTVQLMQRVLKPAQLVGIQVDRPALDAYEARLTDTQHQLLETMQERVPDALRPLTGGTQKAGLTRPPTGAHPKATTTKRDGTAKKDADDLDPIKVELYARHARLEEHRVERQVRYCRACGAEGVPARHRCDAPGGPDLVVGPRLVSRWFWREPFNPDSPAQVLAYLKYRRHTPGRNKKTRGDATDRETLVRLLATTRDPFYRDLLDYRAVAKVRGTYAIGVRKRLDRAQRFHPTPTLKPSTLRTSYVAPNIQNVTTDRKLKNVSEAVATLAGGFRRCVVASPGCRLWELDFSGIEAVLVGWFARDPAYYRLAKLGVHAYVASHLLKRPADLAWSDDDLAAYFREIKASAPYEYDQAKRTVHGNGYGMTAKGMWLMFPDLYPSEKAAKRVQDVYFAAAPSVPAWQNAVQLRAQEQTYLGGAPQFGHTMLTDPNAHPYSYRHDFYGVVAYRPIGPEARKRLEAERVPLVEMNGRLYAATRGEDAKRALAFYPQSTAAGILKEVLLACFLDPEAPHYVGDAYFGRTPLRAPIHDSLLLEVPTRQEDRVLEAVFTEMLRPVEELPLPPAWHRGACVTIGVEAKVGVNWQDVEKVKTPDLAHLGLTNDANDLASDRTYWPATEDEEEDLLDLSVGLGLGREYERSPR